MAARNSASTCACPACCSRSSRGRRSSARQLVRSGRQRGARDARRGRRKVIPAGVAVYGTQHLGRQARARRAQDRLGRRARKAATPPTAPAPRISAAARHSPAPWRAALATSRPRWPPPPSASTWNTNCPISRIRPWNRSTASPTCARMAATCGSARRCSRRTAMRPRASSASTPSKVTLHNMFLGGGFGRRAQRNSDVVGRSRAAVEGRRQAGSERVHARRRRARAFVSPARDVARARRRGCATECPWHGSRPS